MIHDFDRDDSIALAGDFVIVNSKKSGVSAFQFDQTFEITQGGCLAAVTDWTNDHPNVLVRRHLASDKWNQCSGPVESFPSDPTLALLRTTCLTSFGNTLSLASTSPLPIFVCRLSRHGFQLDGEMPIIQAFNGIEQRTRG